MEKYDDHPIHEKYDELSLLYKQSGDEFSDYSIEMLKVTEMPIHFCGEVELIYVLEGSYSVKVSFNNYFLKAGDFLLINSYELHMFVPTGKNNLILSLKINRRNLSNKLFAFDYDYYNRINIKTTAMVKEKMTELYLAEKYNAGDPANIINDIVETIDTKFQIQDFNVTEKSKVTDKTTSTNLERVKHAYERLYFKYTDKLRLKDIADSEHIDSFYASRLIKELTGESFQFNVNTVRIDRAEVFLLGTDMPIQEISASLGFSSYDYFNKNFKELFGMSASSYRKENKSITYPEMQMDVEMVELDEEECSALFSDVQAIKTSDGGNLNAQLIVEIFENVLNIASDVEDHENISLSSDPNAKSKKLSVKSGGRTFTLTIEE